MSTLLVAQEDPFYFPPNEPIPDTMDNGLILLGHKYPSGGFQSIKPEEQFSTRELIWTNAPYIIEGLTLRVTRNDSLYYPGLKISDTEQYYIIPYLVYYQYKGQPVEDTIYILQARADYNFVYPPSNHNCNISSIGNSGDYNNRSFVFLQSKIINGKQYYINCDYNYDGFAYIYDLDKYYDSKCFINGSGDKYTKAELLAYLEQYTGNLTENISTTALKIFNDKEEKEKRKEEEIRKNVERRQAEQKQKENVIHLRGMSKSEKEKQLKKKAINVKRNDIELRSTGDDIYYTIDNQLYSDLGNGNYEFSFDVFGTATNCCHYFGQSSIFLNYNTEAFGDSIDFENKVTTIKASDFTSNKYQILQGDYDDDILLVSVWNSDDNFLGKEFPAKKNYIYSLLRLLLKKLDAM